MRRDASSLGRELECGVLVCLVCLVCLVWREVEWVMWWMWIGWVDGDSRCRALAFMDSVDCDGGGVDVSLCCWMAVGCFW